mgnify:CR=1 FL=1
MPAPKIFSNVILGQFVLSGVPVKVYASGRFLTLTDTDDVEDSTIGFGMDEDGEMIQFSYPEVEFIQVHGNKVDIDIYNKGMAAIHGGDEAPADAEAAAEDSEEEPKKEESISMKLKDLIKENFLGDLPSSKLMKMKWNPLSEISKDEYKAQEDALKAEMDAKKAGMKAAKDKLNALKKQPIEDGMIPEAVYIDIEHAVKDIKAFNKEGDLSSGTTPYDLVISILKNLGFKLTTTNIRNAIDHLQSSMDRVGEIPEDPQVVRELYPLMEDTLKEYTFGTGDIIHDRDPACPHFGSKGIVITSTPDEVRYTVTNGGPEDQYKPGDILSKEPQQLEVYK